jgi:hypothetical protein
MLRAYCIHLGKKKGKEKDKRIHFIGSIGINWSLKACINLCLTLEPENTSNMMSSSNCGKRPIMPKVFFNLTTLQTCPTNPDFLDDDN